MKKFRLFKLILLTLFVFKILLTSSFADYNLETESKLWEALDKNLKEKKQEEQRQKEQEEQILEQAQEEEKQKEQEEQRLKQEQEAQRLKQEQEEQRLKQAQEEQKQKEQEKQRLKQAQEEQKQKEQEEQRQKKRDKEKALLSKMFPENELSIIAKIDNEIVTSHVLKVESKYLEALNPNLKNLSQEQITKIAKESIIREKIKTNEILKYYKLGKDTAYLNKLIATTFNKIGLKNENEFNNYLSKYDLKIDDVKRKFEIEATWNKLIFEKYQNQVEVDIKKIKKKLKKEESRLNKQEIFLLSEILFSAENKEKLDKKYKKILKSIKEIGFKNTANIYSTSDTAKFGGSIGWIQQNQISKIVVNELSKINVGEFTKAISIPGGLIIVKIDEKKVNELEIDFDRELKKMIQFEKNKQLSQFSSIYYKKIKNNIKINEN